MQEDGINVEELKEAMAEDIERLTIRRTAYGSAENGTTAPTDQWLGVTMQRFSPGVREMGCREALHCSFQVASDNLQRTAQLPLNSRSLREMTEHQGRAVLTAQRDGSLRPAFTAADSAAETLISGADGVMVPLVTELQKRRRRETESTKRIAQGRSSTAKGGRPKKGSDGDYKEFKVLAFYDPDQSHCHVVGTSGDHEVLAALYHGDLWKTHGKAQQTPA